MSDEKRILFGSFTEHEERKINIEKSYLEEKTPMKIPRYHKDKCVGSIRFGSLNLVDENCIVNPDGKLNEGETDRRVKCRPPCSRPCSSDKIFLFGSFTEHEERYFIERSYHKEKNPMKIPRYHKDKSVRNIHFGSLNLADENCSVNPDGKL